MRRSGSGRRSWGRRPIASARPSRWGGRPRSPIAASRVVPSRAEPSDSFWTLDALRSGGRVLPAEPTGRAPTRLGFDGGGNKGRTRRAETWLSLPGRRPCNCSSGLVSWADFLCPDPSRLVSGRSTPADRLTDVRRGPVTGGSTHRASLCDFEVLCHHLGHGQDLDSEAERRHRRRGCGRDRPVRPGRQGVRNRPERRQRREASGGPPSPSSTRDGPVARAAAPVCRAPPPRRPRRRSTPS